MTISSFNKGPDNKRIIEMAINYFTFVQIIRG